MSDIMNLGELIDGEFVGALTPLAAAFQAVVGAHIKEAASTEAGEAAGALVGGMASTLGWLLTMMPQDHWSHAIKLLLDQSLVAANVRRDREQSEPTIQ